MSKRTVSGITLTLLLMGMLTLAFNSEPVESDWTWTETIFIRADGSVDPPIAPISTVDNVTYALTDNIIGDVPEWSSAIVVERDNIVVDGVGYTVQGTGNARDHSIVIGMNLTERSNVTIKNMEIKTFRYGITLSYSSNNTISGNNITKNYIGIDLSSSSNNTISGNNIRNNFWNGIVLRGSNNTISGNNLTNNVLPSNSWGGGIVLRGSNNTISGNNVIGNYGYGIKLNSTNNRLRNNRVSNNEYNFAVYGSLLSDYIQDIDDSNTANGKPVYYWINRRDMTVPLEAGYVALINCTSITVKNLELTNNARGVLMVYTTNSTITKNNITNNIDGILGVQSHRNIFSENKIANNSQYSLYPSGYGIHLKESSNNTMSRNNVTNNYWNGIDLSSSSNNDVSGNSITDNRNGIDLSSSSNNTISGNNVTNNGDGVDIFADSNNNSVLQNNITNNYHGIHLDSSSNNSILGNYIANNDLGIWLGISSYNSFYHNSFVNNIGQVYDVSWALGFAPSINVWNYDYPSGGNYWSNYTGVDSNHDGIGDSPHIIDANNTDNYPLMGTFNSYNVTYFTPPLVPHACNVKVISNSTISDFGAPIWIEHPEVTSLMFNASGAEGSTGFCRVSFPTAMMNGTYHVFVNGTEVPYILLPCSNADDSYLYFTYTHSTKEVVIIPELPIFFILPLFMIVTLLVAIVFRKRRIDAISIDLLLHSTDT